MQFTKIIPHKVTIVLEDIIQGSNQMMLKVSMRIDPPVTEDDLEEMAQTSPSILMGLGLRETCKDMAEKGNVAAYIEVKRDRPKDSPPS